jgi:hypothetical protein
MAKMTCPGPKPRSQPAEGHTCLVHIRGTQVSEVGGIISIEIADTPLTGAEREVLARLFPKTQVEVNRLLDQEAVVAAVASQADFDRACISVLCQPDDPPHGQRIEDF